MSRSFLHALFVVYRRHFPPYPVVSSSGLVSCNDVLDFSGFLIALPTRDALCWIMYVVVSVMVSMSSGYCCVSNRFLNSS